MTRNLALWLVVCLGMWHGSAWALGLGEITVHSELNEPFRAEIELRSIDGLTANEIIPNLASSEDFGRIGVQRFFYLSELEFASDLSDPSRPRIQVTSRRPINEPFVNFVLEVRWPTGRLLREYTVLLDPPSHGPAVAAPVLPQGQRSEPPQPERRAPAPGSRVRTDPGPAPGASRAVGRLDGNTYGITGRNDTLWEIALQVRPSANVTTQQTMLALARVNPDAFIGGNINLLKAGYVLAVPEEQEILRLSARDAVLQVADHNTHWQSGTPLMPMDARSDSVAGTRPDRSAGELRLVAGEGDVARLGGAESGGANGSASEVASLRGQLADLEGRLEGAETARATAERQASEAARERAEFARQLEVRNADLARLQRELAEQQAAQPLAQQTTTGILGLSWVILATLLLVLVLALAAALFVGRRSARVPADAAVNEVPEPHVERTQLMSAARQDAASTGVGAGVGVAAASAGAVGTLGGTPADEQADAIAEADVYMAYGRFSEAARVLGLAIEQDGARADLRLKLLEVLVETGDVEAFNEQANVLNTFADSQTLLLADELADRLPGAVSSSGEVAEGHPANADEIDFDVGDAGALDSLDIDLDVDNDDVGPAASVAATSGEFLRVSDEQEAQEAQAPIAKSDDETEFELDLDLDLDETLQPEANGEPVDAEFAALEPTGLQPSGLDGQDGADEQNGEIDLAQALDDSPFDLPDEQQGQGAAPVVPDSSPAELAVDLDESDFELDLGDTGDETSTKLELARAYLDMGDEDGAKEILTEVARDGTVPQQQEADDLLARLG